MRRVLIRWRGFTIWSYPTMLYAGLVVGVAVGNLAAHVAGVDAFRVFVATLILIAPVLAGARLLYVATRWNYYRNHPDRIWNRQQGGLAMYGGLPVMLLLSAPLLAALDVPYGAFWDVAAFTVLTGMILTKIGCLLNGCCAGRHSCSPIAISLPNIRGVWERRIPVQCLEAVWAAVLLVFASAFLGRLPFQGALFLYVAALYGAGRLALESMREPEPEGGTVAAQACSVVTIILAVGTLAVRWPK